MPCAAAQYGPLQGAIPVGQMFFHQAAPMRGQQDDVFQHGQFMGEQLEFATNGTVCAITDFVVGSSYILTDTLLHDLSGTNEPTQDVLRFCVICTQNYLVLTVVHQNPPPRCPVELVQLCDALHDQTDIHTFAA